jgi:hypothetical protein
MKEDRKEGKERKKAQNNSLNINGLTIQNQVPSLNPPLLNPT